MGTAVKRLRQLAAVLFLGVIAVGAVHAQDGPQPGDDASGDPPSRVARLSYMAGDVGFLPSGAKDWSDASLNRPLTRGDRLSTSQGARAELELGGSTLRINGQTDLGFLDLNDQVSQIELTQGTLNLSVRSLADGQSYEIDTPTVALVVDRPGTFRVDIANDGKTSLVSVFSGGGTVYGENSAQRPVSAGRNYAFADSGLANVTISELDGGDNFDNWSAERDRRYVQSDSSQYVSPDIVGYQDLDNSGDWQNDADVGAIWFPSHVGADWAPYRDGHWAWVAPWGWTWVDDLPWGFAPYHYGRWAYVRGAWGWVPGPRFERPVYAPALVAFVGGVGIGIGVGGPVGWFPLGPRDVYNPWYHASRGYYTQINVTNINVHNNFNRTTIVNNINNNYSYFRKGQPTPGVNYANRSAPRAFTAVPANVFTGAGRVSHAMVSVDPAKLAGARVMTAGNGIRPTAASLAPPRPAGARPLPAAASFNRQVVARRTPPTLPGAAGNLPQAAVGKGRPGATPVSTRPSNVRVLGNQGGAPEARTANNGANAATPPQRGIPGRPATTVNPVGPANRVVEAPQQGNAPSSPRAGELPSSRFAHPAASPNSNVPQSAPGRGEPNAVNTRQPQPTRGEPAPRPGVSFVQPAPSPVREARPLPQPENIQPSRNAQQPERSQFENVQRAAEPQPQPREVLRPQPQPREEPRAQPQPQPREEPRAQPQPQPREEPRPQPQPQPQPQERFGPVEHAPPAQQRPKPPANNRKDERTGKDER